MLRIIALQHQLARTFLARAAPELVRALEVPSTRRAFAEHLLRTRRIAPSAPARQVLGASTTACLRLTLELDARG